MEKWTRLFYQPCLPLGEDGRRMTGSREHIALSRKAAGEGMVLVKNEKQALPLRKGEKIAVFGKGCADYVKGGGGSGDVTVAYVRNLLDGLRQKEQEGKVTLFAALGTFYEEEVKKQYAQGIVPGMTEEPEIPEALLEEAAAFASTALVSICRFSGENWDRTIVEEEHDEATLQFQTQEEDLIRRSSQVFEKGDFYLSKGEERMLEQVKARFPRVIAVLNVGGMVDTQWFFEEERIQAALMAWQGGMEGGLAMADVLCGDVNPSGKLTDTFARRLEDYPSSDGFHDSESYVNYTEDIYVGYRYFETIPEAASRVNYPFGYGLSYTEFEVAEKKTQATEEEIRVWAEVTNTGCRPGKEVVQLYVSGPAGKLGRPGKELKAFAKTRELQPGESQTVKLTVPVSELASFDDLGKIRKSAYVLEKGSYRFFLGVSVRDGAYLKEALEVGEDRVICQLSSKCAPQQLEKRLLSDGSYEALPTEANPVSPSVWDPALGPYAPDVEARKGERLWGGPAEEKITLLDVAKGRHTLDEFMGQLTLEEKIHLTCGQPNTGVSNTMGIGNLPRYGVPNAATADGPAGLRIQPWCGVCTTAFPCATLLACTWDPVLVEEIGEAGAAEVEENNIGVWLTPAMNIHRSPLCGRNFEYFSEDPLIAGKMGAALVRGIQSRGIAASVKHFACNNKETNRFESDSRLSERALREIYLKGFEITVKEGDPWTVMSSYNILNGTRTSENRELLTDILRGEWGFRGMVTTDWWNHGEPYLELKAGNDLKMGCGYPKRVLKDCQEGRISEEEIEICAKRVLEMLLKLN